MLFMGKLYVNPVSIEAIVIKTTAAKFFGQTLCSLNVELYVVVNIAYSTILNFGLAIFNHLSLFIYVVQRL